MGSFAPNSYGLFDMIGNVQEWCWDMYDPEYYRDSPETIPAGPAVSSFTPRLLSVFVSRGGSWRDLAFNCRLTRRIVYYQRNRTNYLGFRPARGL